MQSIDPVILGLILAMLGGSAYLLLPILLVGIERLRKRNARSEFDKISSDAENHNRALLIIRSGGILGFANLHAQSWFNIEDINDLQLDWLAGRIYPTEQFLKLCSVEGSEDLMIQGRAVTAYSYIVPTENETVMIISMEEKSEGTPEGLDESLAMLQSLDEEFKVNYSFEETINIVFKVLDNLVDVEIINILMDRERSGELTSVVPVTNQIDHSSGLKIDFAGKIFSEKKPLKIDNLMDYGLDAAYGDEDIEGSYYGFPLLNGSTSVGVIEFRSIRTEAVTQRQFNLLNSLSRQIASVFIAALDQKREAENLEGLVIVNDLLSIDVRNIQKSQVAGLLLENLNSLFGNEAAGFFLYSDEGLLEPSEPFIGVNASFWSDKVLQLKSVLDNEMLVISKDSKDGAVSAETLGMAEFFDELNIESGAMIPMLKGEVCFGYLLISLGKRRINIDDNDGIYYKLIGAACAEVFNQQNVHQSSQVMHSQLNLVQQISAISGKFANKDEFIKGVFEIIADFDQISACCMLSENESIGSLQIQLPYQTGFPLIASPNVIPSGDPGFKESVTFTRRPHLVENFQANQEHNKVYRLLTEMVGEVKSILSIPIILQNGSKGELVAFSQIRGAFNEVNLAIWLAIGELLTQAQAPAAPGETSDADLLVKLNSLSGILRMNTELNQAATEEDLMRIALKHIQDLEPLAEPRIYLLFEDGQSIITERTGTDRNSHNNLPLILRESIHTQSQISVNDFNTSSFQPPYQGVSSCLITPMALEANSSGLIGIFYHQPNNITNEIKDIIQAYAFQFKSALEITRLNQRNIFEVNELKARTDTLSEILLSTQLKFKDQGIERILESVTNSIRENTPYEVVIIYLLDSQTQMFNGVSFSGVLVDKLEDASELVHSYPDVQLFLLNEYKVMNSYFVPSDAHPPTQALILVSTLLTYASAPSTENPWEVGDSLIIPIHQDEGLAGLICVDAPRDNSRPDLAIIQKLEKYAQEIQSIRKNIADFSGLEPDLQQATSDFAHGELQSIEEQISKLLHKDLEQTLALQQVFERAQRVRVGLEIAEHVNTQPDRSSVLQVLGNQMITKLGFDSVLIAENAPLGPRLITQLGGELEGINPDALLGQKNPLSQTLSDGYINLVNNLEQNTAWKNSPLLSNLDAQGFISFPIIINEEVEAALLATSRTALSTQTAEDEQIYSLIGNQVAIAIQNLKLLTETRRRLREVNLLLDFSQQLGSLDPAEILTTLIESTLQVMSHAHAGVVLILEPNGKHLVPQAATGYTNNDQILKILYREGEALPGRVFVSGEPQRIEEVDFAADYNLSQENLLFYREGTGGRVPVSSMIVPIKAGDQSMGILVVDNFNTIAAFSEEDGALVLSLTKQTALTLENARLFQASDQRAKQLQTLTDVRAGDEFPGAIAISKDISHRIEVDRLKSDFVATFSHELRTPITPIKGYVDILLMGGAGEITEKQREFLQVVKSNTTRLTNLVNDLLNVSIIEAGESTLNLEEFSLGELTLEILQDFKQKYVDSDKDIEISVDIPDDLPAVNANINIIRTMLESILDNTYRYIDKIGNIHIKYSYDPKNVICIIEDTGIGISAEDQKRVFDRFYRVEDPLVMASAGTGLGLAIVKDIIEMHGGTIELESEGVSGKGTKISFTLPIS